MRTFCVGEMVVDFLPGSEPGSYIRRAGGAPANVAIALARQNCEAVFCGMLGNDDFGRFLLGVLRENKVIPCVTELTDRAVTTLVFVTLDDRGERSFTFARKPGADMLLTLEHVDNIYFEQADIIHAGSCSLSAGTEKEATVYALREGRRRRKLISFDVNYRSLLWNDDREAAKRAVYSVLPYIDFLKISEEETDMLGGEENLFLLMRENGITLTLVTLGRNGSRCYWKNRVLEAQGLDVECVDACGAGDAFWGVFLSVLLKNGMKTREDLSEELIVEAMRLGNIAGGLCVQKKGAVESLPTREELLRYRRKMRV